MRTFALFLLLGLGWAPLPRAVAQLSAAAVPLEREGEPYFRVDLASPAVRAGVEAQGAKVVAQEPGGTPCLEVVIAGDPATKLVHIPFDIGPLAGDGVVIEASIQGDAIATPAHAYWGAKCQVSYSSAALGRQYQDEQGIDGTFPWRTTRARFTVAPDAQDGQISLGLQATTGTVRISDIEIRIVARKPIRPPPVAVLDQQATRWRGFMSPNVFRAQDFQDMKAWGANLVRWQLGGGDADPDDYDAWLAKKLDELALALDAAAANGIKLVIDLHRVPGGRLPDGTMRLVLEKKYSDQLVATWEAIARRFHDHPALWGYDIMNEPVQNQASPPGVENWLAVQVRAAKAIRAIDARTPVIVETDGWDSPLSFALLEPVDVPNVIYQVHMYFPGTYTHQGVHTNQGVALGKDTQKADIVYPGMIEGRKIDKEALRRCLEPVREFQRAYNAHIYVGEFSVIRWAPGGAQYLADLISIFEEYRWDWTYHAFREWGGWSLEYDNQFWAPGMPKPEPATAETDRAKVVKRALSQNQP